MPERETTLKEDLDQLIEQMEIAKTHGIGGHNLAQRIDGDLRRIMNSAWLNLSDYSYLAEIASSNAPNDKLSGLDTLKNQTGSSSV